MSTLLAAMSSAMTKSLLASLPKQAAEKFELEETEFKEFLQTFLTSQLGKAAKGGRAPAAKGKNGKGRVTGYLLFSNENRAGVKEETPDIKFTEVGKELGRMWGELTDAQKEKWNSKARTQNEENGLPTPTPGASKAKGKAATGAKKATATKGKAAAATDVMKITRHGPSKAWVIAGTQFAVQSPKNKAVIGKLRGNKVVALSAADVKKCEGNGWDVKPAPTKAAAKSAPAKSRKPAPVEDDAEDDDEGSDDDDSDA